MEERMTTYSRSRQVLRILKEYGPLSFSTLRRMMQPPIKARRLRDTLARMCRRGYIVRRHQSIFRNACAFYQLAQASEMRDINAKILKCSSDSLHQPHFSNRELLHSDTCASWVHLFRKHFPMAKIVRDYEFQHDVEAKRAMLLSDSTPELSPDILILFRNTTGRIETSIAVEVERTRKSNQRLIAKLKKYATGTLVDGLIYVCTSDMISDAVKAVYRNSILTRAHRIRHYGDNFLVFAEINEVGHGIASSLINSNREVINFNDWIVNLTATNRNDRRDKNFAMSANDS